MKQFLISLLAFIPQYSFGQLIDELPKNCNGELCYSEVVQVDRIQKIQFYLNSKRFFVESFKSLDDVIQKDDADSVIVIGKGFNYIPIISSRDIFAEKMWYTIKIQSKEGRYKYEIYNISITKSGYGNYKSSILTPNDIFDKKNYYGRNGVPLDVNIMYKKVMEDNIHGIVALIKAYMILSDSTGSQKDNW
jgi:hypothetical protein